MTDTTAPTALRAALADLGVEVARAIDDAAPSDLAPFVEWYVPRLDNHGEPYLRVDLESDDGATPDDLSVTACLPYDAGQGGVLARFDIETADAIDAAVRAVGREHGLASHGTLYDALVAATALRPGDLGRVRVAIGSVM